MTDGTVVLEDPTARLASFEADPSTPRWAKDILRFVPLKSQFLLVGNIRDWYPFPTRSNHRPLSMRQYLSSMLRLAGFDHVLGYDAADGFYPLGTDPNQREATQAFAAERLRVPFQGPDRPPSSLMESGSVIDRIVKSAEQHRQGMPPVALVIDYASRLVPSANRLSGAEHEFFLRMLKLSHEARARPIDPLGTAFHAVFWLADRETDLPSWGFGENQLARTIPIPLPDQPVRRLMIETLAAPMTGTAELEPADRAKHVRSLVQQTEGLMLRDLVSVVDVANRDGLGLKGIEDAARRYKLGVTEDRWGKLEPDHIRRGEEFIARRVKGQRAAIVAALDIVKRAMTGLAGAQASGAAARPKGVLFLAGPTGVGKTELAKALTELLFGDEQNYIRFDMSEFAAEHTASRLLGAPPGYVGHDAGGELINAIREKPVSLVLFDEIEKAHERILDKFLQLLDDGVLTSGRGERVYFSDCLIVFTSNLGVVPREGSGDGQLAVHPDDPDREKRIVQAIEDYFNRELGRPEILNRLGENIVVFDFIRPDVAVEIFEKMVEGIRARLLRERETTLEITPAAREALVARCTSDLKHGGRGIGNMLERWLINPLARALFDEQVPPRSAVRILSVKEEDGSPTLELERVR